MAHSRPRVTGKRFQQLMRRRWTGTLFPITDHLSPIPTGLSPIPHFAKLRMHERAQASPPAALTELRLGCTEC